MSQQPTPETHCARCQTPFAQYAKVWPGGGGIPGYACVPQEDGSEIRICYPCAAKDEEAYMTERGRITLYWDDQKHAVTNWSGHLSFITILGRAFGRHNIAGCRMDVWFRDHQQRDWHGVLYGRNTQLLHCKRLKKNLR